MRTKVIPVNLGSHNSWSYAKPEKWYIPHFPAKCQEVDIKEQYNCGARWFDLRLKLNKRNSWRTAHGISTFDVDYIEDLKFLNETNEEPVYVRVILEYNKKPKNHKYIISRFKNKCHNLQVRFGNIKFIGGRSKWDWETLYSFDTKEPAILDKYSSTTSLFKSDSYFLRIIDDWWPWLYARLKNKENFREFCKTTNGEFLIMDFINYR